MDHHGEIVDTVVIGGGQAGLAVGYYLRKRKADFVILDAGERVGDAWRNRWDSLRLFTPARFNGLPGMRFPAPPTHYPTKDEVADYLEAYAGRFKLPVRNGCRVEKLSKSGDGFIVSTGNGNFMARNVVVAMSNYQLPGIPEFASKLSPEIVQLHAGEYRNPGVLREGGVLVVGAANSGCEIALDCAKAHRTWLSGRHPGHVPFRIESWFGRHIGVPFVVGLLFHRILSVGTPIGRKVRPKLVGSVGPNVRIKPKDIAAAGIETVPKTVGVKNGKPVLEDGRVLDVANVIWCTGYRPDFSWVDLPVFGDEDDPKEPLHDRGVVASEPGLYFVGLFFLRSITSSFLRGVGRDAKHVVKVLKSGA
ncbi:MAG: flavin-containing monooxygenase [Alphaproteobacteria bacterium]